MTDNTTAQDGGTAEEPIQKIKDELKEFENEYVHVSGTRLKACQCYYISDDPFHILYNTNCPSGLKERIDAIVAKWAEKK